MLQFQICKENQSFSHLSLIHKQLKASKITEFQNKGKDKGEEKM